MIAPAIFQGIVLPSVAIAANHGKRAQTFANVTQKCVCENTDPLMEMSNKEDEDIDESFSTLLPRLWTFNVFFSYITWQNYCFLSSDGKFPI